MYIVFRFSLSLSLDLITFVLCFGLTRGLSSTLQLLVYTTLHYITLTTLFQFSDELDSVDTKKAGRRATELLLQAHLSSPLLPPAAMTTFRRRVMAKRFRDLPTELLEDFVDTFHGDFALFGYEPRPDDIFGP